MAGKGRLHEDQTSNLASFGRSHAMSAQMRKFRLQSSQDAGAKPGRVGEQGTESAQVRLNVATELDAFQQELGSPRQPIEATPVPAPRTSVARLRTPGACAAARAVITRTACSEGGLPRTDEGSDRGS